MENIELLVKVILHNQFLLINGIVFNLGISWDLRLDKTYL